MRAQILYDNINLKQFVYNLLIEIKLYCNSFYFNNYIFVNIVNLVVPVARDGHGNPK